MRVRWLPQGKAVLYMKLDYNQQYKTLHHNERTQVKGKKNGENGRKKGYKTKTKKSKRLKSNKKEELSVYDII